MAQYVRYTSNEGNLLRALVTSEPSPPYCRLLTTNGCNLIWNALWNYGACRFFICPNKGHFSRDTTGSDFNGLKRRMPLLKERHDLSCKEMWFQGWSNVPEICNTYFFYFKLLMSVSSIHAKSVQSGCCTGNTKETKQQPGTLEPGNILGCCLVFLRFLCVIHSIHYVPR